MNILTLTVWTLINVFLSIGFGVSWYQYRRASRWMGECSARVEELKDALEDAKHGIEESNE